ncbi:MAG: hypothetical protein MRERC_3c042 [Mycoplasmataceae bacterium RC_NB112A]|nr:MAG: hypothetical protein MRERC_3c042 [Mycoplasmataceae bacterium RC_NB112A]
MEKGFFLNGQRIKLSGNLVGSFLGQRSQIKRIIKIRTPPVIIQIHCWLFKKRG